MLLLPLTAQAMSENEGELDQFFYQDNGYLFRSSYFSSNRDAQELQANIRRIKIEIEELLESEIDVNDDKCRRLLSEASYHEQCSDLLELMLQRGVNPNVEFHGTPLKSACWSGCVKNVTLLLKYKADPNLGCPLVTASEQGHSEIVKLLLGHENIDVDLQDEVGNTALSGIFNPLFLGLKNENICKNLVLTLLGAGANPYIKTSGEKTAIDVARKNDFEALAIIMERFWA